MDKIRSESLEKLLMHSDCTTNNIAIAATTNGSCGNNNSSGGDLSKLLEPVDESRLSHLMNTYKSLNRTEQILFLLRIQNNGNISNRSNELVETSNWLRANFTVDSQVAIPKEEVYQMYKKYTKLAKPVSTADFGKIVRQVFPQVKPRRLGQRGSSRYCYANIRKKSNPDVPTLPTIESSPERCSTSSKILNWANKTFSQNFQSLDEFSNMMENLTEIVQHQHQTQPALQKRGVKRSCSSCSLQNHNQQQQLEKVPIPRLKREDSCTSDDPELQTYFCTKDEKWPHLRRLLTNSNDGNPIQFTPIAAFRPPSASSTVNGNSSLSSKKKRHYSTAATMTQQSAQSQLPPMTPRSQSVPLNHIESPFEDEYGGDSGIGSLSSTPRNPMLSSVSNEILKPNDNLMLIHQQNQADQIDDQLLGFEFDPVFDYDFGLN